MCVCAGGYPGIVFIYTYTYSPQKKKITSRCGDIDREVSMNVRWCVYLSTYQMHYIYALHCADDFAFGSVKGNFKSCHLLSSRRLYLVSQCACIYCMYADLTFFLTHKATE